MKLGTPWMLLLLPLIALAAGLMLRARRLQREASCRLKGGAADRALAALGRRDWLALAALACVALALARPQWDPRPYDLERRGRDLVIVLDVSRSMLAADVFPSRLEAARIAIHEALPALAGHRIALITFAGSASVRVPLTLDHGFVRYMLERASPSDMDLGSTSLQAAFEKAVGTVLTDAAGGRRDLVVFTDGEDHLSDLGKTAGLLEKCGARILIIGLGDPVRGARVPDAVGPGQWMRHEGAEVVSRLDESTLAKLSARSDRVTYAPVRTRPFDLATLYQQMIAGAAGDAVVGELRQVRYTEGYPVFLGLSVALWLALARWGLPAASNLLVLALLLPGCSRRIVEDADAAFQARAKRGGELLGYAGEPAAADSAARRSLLLDAREEFLRAALLRPGDIGTARQITAITRRLREVEATLEKQRAEELKRHESLARTIERLEQLAGRQERLAQQSSQLLRRRLLPRKMDLSNSSESDNEMSEDKAAAPSSSSRNDNRLAGLISTEQQAVREATTGVLDSVTFQRNTIRQLLTRAYGDTGKTPPTELDPAGVLLAGAVTAQEQALASLEPESVRWPQANTAFHTAAGRMQQALESLRSLQPPSQDLPDNAMPSRNDAGYDEDQEGPGPGDSGNKSQPVSAGDFQAALSLRELPVPDYTSAEILAEESANQEKRARQKAARAGAKVEKNW